MLAGWLAKANTPTHTCFQRGQGEENIIQAARKRHTAVETGIIQKRFQSNPFGKVLRVCNNTRITQRRLQGNPFLRCWGRGPYNNTGIPQEMFQSNPFTRVLGGKASRTRQEHTQRRSQSNPFTRVLGGGGARTTQESHKGGSKVIPLLGCLG